MVIVFLRILMMLEFKVVLDDCFIINGSFICLVSFICFFSFICLVSFILQICSILLICLEMEIGWILRLVLRYSKAIFCTILVIFLMNGLSCLLLAGFLALICLVFINIYHLLKHNFMPYYDDVLFGLFSVIFRFLNYELSDFKLMKRFYYYLMRFDWTIMYLWFVYEDDYHFDHNFALLNHT